jgi:hypothetical protein
MALKEAGTGSATSAASEKLSVKKQCASVHVIHSLSSWHQPSRECCPAAYGKNHVPLEDDPCVPMLFEELRDFLRSVS